MRLNARVLGQSHGDSARRLLERIALLESARALGVPIFPLLP